MIKNIFLVLISDLDEMLSSLGVAPVSEVLSSLSSVNSMTSDNSANATPDGSLQPASLNNGTRYDNEHCSAHCELFQLQPKIDVMMIPIFVLIAVREQANDRQLVLVLCQCRQLRFHLRKQSRTRNKHKQLILAALSVMVGTFIIRIFLCQNVYKIYVSNTSLPKTAFKSSIIYRFSLRFNIGIFVSHDNLIF